MLCQGLELPEEDTEFCLGVLRLIVPGRDAELRCRSSDVGSKRLHPEAPLLPMLGPSPAQHQRGSLSNRSNDNLVIMINTFTIFYTLL